MKSSELIKDAIKGKVYQVWPMWGHVNTKTLLKGGPQFDAMNKALRNGVISEEDYELVMFFTKGGFNYSRNTPQSLRSAAEAGYLDIRTGEKSSTPPWANGQLITLTESGKERVKEILAQAGIK